MIGVLGRWAGAAAAAGAALWVRVCRLAEGSRTAAPHGQCTASQAEDRCSVAACSVVSLVVRSIPASGQGPATTGRGVVFIVRIAWMLRTGSTQAQPVAHTRVSTSQRNMASADLGSPAQIRSDRLPQWPLLPRWQGRAGAAIRPRAKLPAAVRRDTPHGGRLNGRCMCIPRQNRKLFFTPFHLIAGIKR